MAWGRPVWPPCGRHTHTHTHAHPRPEMLLAHAVTRARQGANPRFSQEGLLQEEEAWRDRARETPRATQGHVQCVRCGAREEAGRGHCFRTCRRASTQEVTTCVHVFPVLRRRARQRVRP